MNQDYMNVQEVRDYLGIARTTIYKYVSEGKLHPVHKNSGRSAYFKRADVEQLNQFKASEPYHKSKNQTRTQPE